MDIKSLLKELSEEKGSDLLLVANSHPTMIKHKVFIKLGEKKLDSKMIKDFLGNILKEDQMKFLATVRDLDTAYEDEFSRYRVNAHFEKGNYAAAIRRISKEIPKLETLGLPPAIREFATIRRGILLVTGPTGCGKTTTQAAMIDLINNSRNAHIITLEDPIEYLHKSNKSIIEQREIDIDTMSFAEGLKRVVRQIPDVILIGEMRDIESIQNAITAAETGHLVISTLHTQDAVQAIDRIIDVFPPYQQAQIKTQLSLTLQGVIAQQLIPKADGKGLTVSVEILKVNPAIRNLIRKGHTQDIYSTIELGGREGMQTMDASLLELYKKGLITKETAVSHAFNRESLSKKMTL